MILSESLVAVVTPEGMPGLPTDTIWTYLSDDPLVVSVLFEAQEVTWDFSLDLLRKAFSSPNYELHGDGDLLIMPDDYLTRFRLSNGSESAIMNFNTEEVRSFLDQIDDSGSSDAISRELDEFLETL